MLVGHAVHFTISHRDANGGSVSIRSLNAGEILGNKARGAVEAGKPTRGSMLPWNCNACWVNCGGRWDSFEKRVDAHSDEG